MSQNDLSLIELRDAIAQRRLSAAEAVRASLDAIRSRNHTLNAFLQVFEEESTRRAEEIDRTYKSSAQPPLLGVPIALKDNICLSWGRTTCASRMLEAYESPYTASAAQRLIDAGAIIIGKTNLDEFSMGSSGEHSAFGPTRNPIDPDRIPGGTSSGSATAVACSMVPGALGSDTGGSIRQPGAMTGIVGLKPTYGTVSRYGLVAYASSLDQIGPLARTVADAALLLGVIAGNDPRDSTSSERAVPDFLALLDEPIPNLRVGVPPQALAPANDPGVNAATRRAIEALRSSGASIVDIELPHMDHAIAAYYIVATAEASSNLARYDGIRYGRRASIGRDEGLDALYARSRSEGFGPEVQRRIMLGTYVLSSGYYDAYYLSALKTRRLIKQDFDRIFSTRPGHAACDVVLMPTAPHPAWKLGEKSSDPLSMYFEDFFTVGANLAGLPAISVPAGTADVPGAAAPLPVGVQLYAPAFADQKLLRIARTLETALG